MPAQNLFTIVNPDGRIFLQFSDLIFWNNFEIGDFVVRIDGVVQPIYLDIASGYSLILETASPIDRLDRRRIDVEYNKDSGSGSSLRDALMLDPVESFTAFNIVNNSTVNALEVMGITRVGASPSNASTVYFRVVFSESVSTYSIQSNDFLLTSTGTAFGETGTPQSFDGGTTWIVPIENISGTGVFRLHLRSSGTDITSSSIPGGFTSPKAIIGGYTQGESYTIDRDAPYAYATSMSLRADTGRSDSDLITNVPNQTLSGTLSANLNYGESVWVSLDGGGSWAMALAFWGDNTWSISASLNEGSNQVSVKVTDTVGNFGTTYNPYVTLDTTAPARASAPIMYSYSDTGISNTDGVTSNTSVVINGNSGSLQTITLFDTDGSTVLATGQAEYGGSWSFTLVGLSEGTHFITARQSDYAGNMSAASDALAVMIDTVAPSMPSALALAADSMTGISSSVTSDTTPSITGNAESGTVVTLYDTDGTTVLGAAIAIGGVWTIASSMLTEGQHSFTVQSTDAAGNVSLLSNSLLVTIDMTLPAAPSVPVLSVSAETGITDGIIADATPTLAGTAESGCTVTLYDTDGATQLGTASAIGGVWSITSSQLSEGAHILTVKATDSAGNSSFSSAGLAITIDTVSPSVTSVVPTDGLMDVPVNSEVRVHFSEALVATSNIANVYLKNARNAVVASTKLIDPNGHLVITPTETLSHGMTYAVTWDANSLFDLVGNSAGAMLSGSGLTFTTAVGSNDVIGGSDGFDTVTLPIPLVELTGFDLSSDGRGFILIGPDGMDTYNSVEQLNFTDISVTPLELRELFTPTVQFVSFQNGVQTTAQPDFFTGPASLNLHYQVIDTSPNAVIIGSTLNDFIVLQGGGNKAVNGGLGDDVIDGGVGSTFISGGGGSNTFFLDGRASGVSWSTITDFNLGQDQATIWGWRQGVSRVKTLETNGGATDYSGLTLHFENLLPDGSDLGALNVNLNSITFSGKSLADFGVSSLSQLNEQIIAGANSHFIVGETTDIYGQHGYLFIS